jgi:diacylglycerol kinase (ATP)
MGKFLTSFKFAWRGICAHFSTQANARVQLAVAVLVVAAGFTLGVAALEWCALILCIMIVFAAEGLNTAIESLADAVHPDRDPLIARAKDVAAGAVLICALGAAVVGVIIFLPYVKLRL